MRAHHELVTVTAELQGGRRLLRRLRGAPAKSIVQHVAEAGGMLGTPPEDLKTPGTHDLLLAAHGQWEIIHLVTRGDNTASYQRTNSRPVRPAILTIRGNP